MSLQTSCTAKPPILYLFSGVLFTLSILSAGGMCVQLSDALSEQQLDSTNNLRWLACSAPHPPPYWWLRCWLYRPLLFLFEMTHNYYIDNQALMDKLLRRHHEWSPLSLEVGGLSTIPQTNKVRVCCFVLLNQYWGFVTVPGFLHERAKGVRTHDWKSLMYLLTMSSLNLGGAYPHPSP